MKIKTFKFVASNNIYRCGAQIKENHSTKEIDDEINEFLRNVVNELIDIKINTFESKSHNNGGYNTVEMIYTIIYK